VGTQGRLAPRSNWEIWKVYGDAASVQLDQRSVTVRPNREKVGDPAPPDGADHGQRPTFESMTLARDRDRIRSIMTLGSLWPRPSIRFRIPS
jgi:hypothetical protein